MKRSVGLVIFSYLLLYLLYLRYRSAGQDAPIILYTDGDCCHLGSPSKFFELFNEWDQLQVMLLLECDIEMHVLYDRSGLISGII